MSQMDDVIGFINFNSFLIHEIDFFFKCCQNNNDNKIVAEMEAGGIQ